MLIHQCWDPSRDFQDWLLVCWDLSSLSRPFKTFEILNIFVETLDQDLETHIETKVLLWRGFLDVCRAWHSVSAYVSVSSLDSVENPDA